MDTSSGTTSPGPFCGDGHADPEEQCDEPQPSATCDPDCTISACGDGYLNEAAGEECDDGNIIKGDGCDGGCHAEFWKLGGIRSDVPLSDLDGWEWCWNSFPDGNATLTEIQQACNGKLVLMLCVVPGSDTATAVAWGKREAVFSPAPVVDNGIQWLFSTVTQEWYALQKGSVSCADKSLSPGICSTVKDPDDVGSLKRCGKTGENLNATRIWYTR